MRRYTIVSCGLWEAVVTDDLVGVDISQSLWIAEALCQDRKDARAIAKRLNVEARKAWARDRARYARRAARRPR